MKKKILSKQTYTLEVIHYDDNTTSLQRTNDGFTVFELLGNLQVAQQDIMDLIRTSIAKPTEVVRKSTNSPMMRKPKSK